MKTSESAGRNELIGSHWIKICKLRSIGRMFKDKSEGLEVAVEEKNQKIFNLETDLQNFRNEVGTLQSSLEQIKDSESTSRKEIATLTKEVEMANAESANLKVKVSELVQLGRNYQSMFKNSEKKVAQKNENLSKLEEELAGLKDANQTLETSMHLKVSENVELKNANGELKEAADGRFERTQSVIVHLLKRLEESRVEISTLNDHLKAEKMRDSRKGLFYIFCIILAQTNIIFRNAIY